MLGESMAWLLAGSPPHWHYVTAGVLAGLLLVSEILAYTKRPTANGVVQGIANVLLLLLGSRVPLLSKVLAVFASEAVRQAVRSRPPDDKPPTSGADTLSILLLLVGLAGMLALLAGCGGAYTAAVKIKGAGSQGLEVAQGEWIEFSARQQLHIVAEAPDKATAHARLDAWQRDIQKPVTIALKAAFLKLEALDQALRAYKAGQTGGLAAAGQAVVQALLQLADTYRRLGLPLPVPKIGDVPQLREARMLLAWEGAR